MHSGLNTIDLENAIRCILRQWNSFDKNVKMEFEFRHHYNERRMEGIIKRERNGKRVFVTSYCWTEEAERALIADLQDHFKNEVLTGLLMSICLTGLGAGFKETTNT